MTAASLATSLLAFGYQMAPRAAGGSARMPAPSMAEARLNNYVLPGPMTPLGNQVMVKLRKVDDKTSGGLFVPKEEVEKPKEGTIIMCGPGKANRETGAMVECPVKEGDLVMLSDFSGENVDYNGEKHLFCDADSLLGVFEGQSLSVGAFKPFADRILVATKEQETQTSTGIALAGLEEEENNSGEVVAVGPGRYADNGALIPTAVTPGESVMFEKYGSQGVTIDGKSFLVVTEDMCLVKW